MILNHYWNNYFNSGRYFNSGCNNPPLIHLLLPYLHVLRAFLCHFYFWCAIFFYISYQFLHILFLSRFRKSAYCYVMMYCVDSFWLDPFIIHVVCIYFPDNFCHFIKLNILSIQSCWYHCVAWWNIIKICSSMLLCILDPIHYVHLIHYFFKFIEKILNNYIWYFSN